MADARDSGVRLVGSVRDGPASTETLASHGSANRLLVRDKVECGQHLSKESPMIRLVMPLLALFAVYGVVRADDPLPPPRVIEAPPGYAIGNPPYWRRSAYEVWQYYGVDRRGFFRPVVVYSPYG